MTKTRMKLYGIYLLLFLIIFSGDLFSQTKAPTKTESSKSNKKSILKVKSRDGLGITAPKIRKISFKEKLRSTYVTLVIQDYYVCGGFVVHSKGYVVTVANVLSPKHTKIEVISAAFGRKEVEIVAVDEGNNLALLKLPDRKERYSALKIARRRPKTYSRTFIFGPIDFRYDVLISGRVASPDPVFFWMEDNEDYTSAFSIASDKPTFYGVPWVNKKCEVIGVQTDMSASAGLNLVIPGESIRNLLKKRKMFSTPTVGLEVEELWQNDEADYRRSIPKGLSGVVIVDVVEKGSASRAGLREGEFIFEMDGKPIKDVHHFITTIRSKKIKSTIEFGVFEPGRKRKRKAFLKIDRLEKGW